MRLDGRFPFVVCWLEINRKAEGGILRSQKKKADLVLCWVGLLEFVASQSAPTAVGLAFKRTLRRKLAFCFLLFLPQTNTQRLNTSVLKMRNGPSLCYFRGPAESHHAQPSISNFSRLPAVPGDVSAKSVASLVSRCRGVLVRLQL